MKKGTLKSKLFILSLIIGVTVIAMGFYVIQQLTELKISSLSQNNLNFDRIKDAVDYIIIIICIGILIILLVAFGGNYYIHYIIRKSLNGLKVTVTALKSGNLRATIDKTENNEIGELTETLNEMISKIKDIVIEIKEATAIIRNYADQLNTGSLKIREETSQQAQTTYRVHNSMNDIANHIEKNAASAKETKDVTKQALHGFEIVNKSSKDSLDSLHKIVEKITIVNDIAMQTNILALNAAVEASRAGELGKGFSVVASEVLKLADKSRIAADEINILTNSSLEFTQETSLLMKRLVPEIKRTAKLIASIAQTNYEQNTEIVNLSESLGELNHSAQHSASLADQVANNTVEMNKYAGELAKLVSYFNV